MHSSTDGVYGRYTASRLGMTPSGLLLHLTAEVEDGVSPLHAVRGVALLRP